jgi:hypothetical protein
MSMPKDRSERRMYRKSPGRQYGYDYDPLRSRSGHSQSGQSRGTDQEERWSTRGEAASHTSTILAQRPDLRRTRQLLRQNIIASKGRSAAEADVQREQPEPEYEQEQFVQRILEEDEPRSRREQRRSSTQSGHSPNYIPTTRELEDLTEDGWQEFEDVDPDLGYEDQPDAHLAYNEIPPLRGTTRTGQYQPTHVPSRAASHSIRPGVPVEPEEYCEENDYDEEEEYEEQPTRRKRRKKLSRRGLLAGIGMVALGGAGIAAYELAPKIPQLANDVGTNLEHQLQDAFNRGVAQGANAVRQEFVTSLENLEGFTLDGAITAARLTRVAYDIFVSPIVKFGAEVAGEFLSTMDRAFITARGWLRNIGQDNATLAAIQNVLDSWVAQVSNLPKQLDAITDADLDGAQAYLHQLQIKLNEEKAKLAASGAKGQQGTATPSSTPRP